MTTEPLPALQFDREQRDLLQQELGDLLREKMLLKQSLQQQSKQTAAEREKLFLELLEVFDAIEFFLNYLAENPEPSPKFIKRLPKTIGTIQKKLLNILERRQVEPIELEDTKPDYSICQVVDCEERADLEEHTITKIIRPGFRIEDRILRSVEVITAKKPVS